MSEHPELICAYRLDGAGRGEPLDWAAVDAWTPDQGPLWVHLDTLHPATAAWLNAKSGLSPFVVDGLLASETRPRCDAFDDGVLLILRGVNLNPGARPEDMVSIRIWIDGSRVISTRMRRLMAVEDVREQFATGRGPVSAGHLVARLAARLTERMAPAIDGLADEVAGLEEQLSGNDHVELRAVRSELVDLRRVAISLRRYIAPQRDALTRLSQLDEDWNDSQVQGRLRETVDRVTRITEELDEVRERSAVVQDELTSRLSQRMERTMYVLTVVATIMLPLGFLTGLLGINVGGIPGADTGWAFWAVCTGLVTTVAIEVWVFRRLGWL
ncbi:MAG: zinc transporter ZntB [Alphaproteobacteria bacterium]